MVAYKKSEHQMNDEEYTAYLEYMTNECYACATQRHKCEHDGRDDSEDLPEWWNEV